jgi:hypothetical protein
MKMAKVHAAAALAKVAVGKTATETLSELAIEFSSSVPEMRHSIRDTRYLVLNEHDKNNPLLGELPSDVLVFNRGWTPTSELVFTRAVKEMGISVSSLPALIGWEPQREVDDGEGGTFIVSASFVELRINDLSKEERVWKDPLGTETRTEGVKSWGLLKTGVPELVEVSGSL